MITCDGASASHALVKHLDRLASRRGYRSPAPSAGSWARGRRPPWRGPGSWLGGRRQRGGQGPRAPPENACGNPRCGHRACWIQEAHVTELTGLLREGAGRRPDEGWPATMRVFARRERPHPGAQLTLFEAEDGWRYSLWVTSRPVTTRGWLGQCAYIDAAHRVHARVEDVIRTGKDTGLSHFPSHDYKVNEAWLDASMTACILLAWLRLLALDGDLARQNRRRSATAYCTPPPGSCAAGGGDR